MRIHSLRIEDAPPVALFEVDDVADVLVVAGPNGVGKTRLLQRMIQLLRGESSGTNATIVIRATSEEERDAWQKPQLELSDPADASLYRTTLQANRRRRNWRSSILQFESDRSIQNIQPLQFGWDMPDPTEEEIGWDFGFGFWKTRWQDTLHSMFRLIEHQKQSIASQAIRLRREGREEMRLNFSDPMEPFKLVFSQLLAPKQLVDPSARRQTLEFELDGEVYNISALSSGEREVINVAFDFQLRKPSDCVVLFDEPELHLHPELSHRLLQTLQGIGLRNQFVLSTHSPDVITASLDKSVVFISPPRRDAEGHSINQALPVSEDDATHQALRLLGHSIGVIALGKKIVLIEGTDSSLDKEVYGVLIKQRFPALVLLPSGGKHVLQNFATINDAVLSQSIWGVEFFMLCDRDSTPAGVPEGGVARLKVLPKYHLENYFLDAGAWAKAFEPLEAPAHWLRDPTAIRAKLRELASGLVSYAAALTVAAAARQSVGNVDLMPSDCHNRALPDLVQLVQARARVERERIEGALLNAELERQVMAAHHQLAASLDEDTDHWTSAIPGKPLLRMFATAANVQYGRLKNLYLSTADLSEAGPFADVVRIFDAVARA